MSVCANVIFIGPVQLVFCTLITTLWWNALGDFNKYNCSAISTVFTRGSVFWSGCVWGCAAWNSLFLYYDVAQVEEKSVSKSSPQCPWEHVQVTVHAMCTFTPVCSALWWDQLARREHNKIQDISIKLVPRIARLPDWQTPFMWALSRLLKRGHHFFSQRNESASRKNKYMIHSLYHKFSIWLHNAIIYAVYPLMNCVAVSKFSVRESYLVASQARSLFKPSPSETHVPWIWRSHKLWCLIYSRGAPHSYIPILEVIFQSYRILPMLWSWHLPCPFCF